MDLRTNRECEREREMTHLYTRLYSSVYFCGASIWYSTRPSLLPVLGLNRATSESERGRHSFTPNAFSRCCQLSRFVGTPHRYVSLSLYSPFFIDCCRCFLYIEGAGGRKGKYDTIFRGELCCLEAKQREPATW